MSITSTKLDLFNVKSNNVRGVEKLPLEVGQKMGKITCVYFERSRESHKDGYGKWVWERGGLYEGRVSDAEKHGFGIHQGSNRGIYEGMWDKGQRNGIGVYTAPGGTYGVRQEGIWINNRLSQGRHHHVDGRVEIIENISDSVGKIISQVASNNRVERELAEGERSDIIKYENGSIYTGQIVDGKRHGEGTLVSEKGNVRTCKGSWRNDQMYIGRIDYSDGSYYDGQFLNGLYEGRGERRFPNGAHYSGQWYCGVINSGNSTGFFPGYGKFTYVDGTTHEGMWEHGRKHGYGKLTYVDGTTSEGMWDQGLQRSYSKLTYVDGTTHEGMWERGRKHGRGIHFDPSKGEEYAGEWEENQLIHKLNGFFEYEYGDGSRHSGEWKDGKKHGRGIHFAPSKGEEYAGEWANNRLICKLNGFFEYKYGDGSRYAGKWKDGKKHGLATYFSSQGTPERQKWENGVQVPIPPVDVNNVNKKEDTDSEEVRTDLGDSRSSSELSVTFDPNLGDDGFN